MLSAGAVVAVPAQAQLRQPAQGRPGAIDGPDGNILRPAGLGMAIARDGRGGLVYLRAVSGVPHVFLSNLNGGSFQTPVEIDSGLGGASSQPVVAAATGGLLLIAFVNDGQLYVFYRGGAGQPFSGPIALASGAANPSLSVSNFGKAYLAFSQAGDGGFDVHTAYYYKGRWALESPPLNVSPGDDAGHGGGAGPSVGAAGDGVGIVVWREAGHIYSRRVWGTNPSVVDEQADAPVGGCAETSVSSPTLGVEGDSSFVDVAFQEELACGAQHQSRVLMNRLRGDYYDGLGNADGLSSPGADGANYPQIAMAEYGQGYLTSQRDGSNPTDANQLYADALGTNGGSQFVFRADSEQNATPPYAVPATAGLYSSLIAWQQNPGVIGAAEVRARYSPSGTGFGSERILSTPSGGPTDAASGLVAAGDASGDAAAAWVQGNSGATAIVIDQLFQPPGRLSALHPRKHVHTAHPVLAWSAPRGSWGPFRYDVRVDGVLLARTYSTSIRVPKRLRNGRHRWRVTAVNRAGLTRASALAVVFVNVSPRRKK